MGDAPKTRFWSAKQGSFTKKFLGSKMGPGKKIITGLVAAPTAIAANIVAAPVKYLGKRLTRTSRHLDYLRKGQTNERYKDPVKLAKASAAIRSKIIAAEQKGDARTAALYVKKLENVAKTYYGGEKFEAMKPDQQLAAIRSITGISVKREFGELRRNTTQNIRRNHGGKLANYLQSRKDYKKTKGLGYLSPSQYFARKTAKNNMELHRQKLLLDKVNKIEDFFDPEKFAKQHGYKYNNPKDKAKVHARLKELKTQFLFKAFDKDTSTQRQKEIIEYVKNMDEQDPLRKLFESELVRKNPELAPQYYTRYEDIPADTLKSLNPNEHRALIGAFGAKIYTEAQRRRNSALANELKVQELLASSKTISAESLKAFTSLSLSPEVAKKLLTLLPPHELSIIEQTQLGQQLMKIKEDEHAATARQATKNATERALAAKAAAEAAKAEAEAAKAAAEAQLAQHAALSAATKAQMNAALAK